MKFALNTVCKFAVVAILALTSPVFGQLYNNGSQITVGNDAVVYIKGTDLVNKDSSIYNSGIIIVEGNCFISNKATSRIISSNGDSLIVLKDFLDSSSYGQKSGVLALKGANQTIYSASGKLASLAIDGTGDKNLTSNANVSANLNLQKGHVIVPSGKTFTLDSTASLSPTGIGVNSFVVGTLYRKRKLGAEDSLFFPIGNSKTEFRPLTLLGIATPTGTFPVYGVTTSTASPQAGVEVSTVYSRIWSLTRTTNDSIKNIKLYYQSTDVASSPPANLVVAQSTSSNGVYNSIGNEIATVAYVKSEFKPTQGFYTIGSSNNLKGSFRVFLEGPYNGQGGMHATLYNNSVLQDSLLKIYAMSVGYTVPPSAIDRVSFKLLDFTTGNAVDSADAWLLSDGQIRDYLTGTRNYVTFAKAQPATKYYAYVSHRNHLTASSSDLILTAAKPAPFSFNYDYTTGVYGGGALYDAGSDAWLLYAADPYKSWKNQTDVIDLLRTGADDNSALYGITGKYYHYTDLNLDGKVNASDFQIANDHNAKLYYSTLPK